MATITLENKTALLERLAQIGQDIKENNESTKDIQERQGKELTTKAHREVFAEMLTELFKTDKKMVKRYQDCVDKPPTQRFMQKLKADTPLKKKIKFRTANKGLVEKNIATKEQVEQKGIYHVLEFPVKPATTLTKAEAIQKVLSDRKITQAEFDVMKLTFHVEEAVAH